LGSSFKPFVAFAALNTGQLPDGEKYYLRDEGTYKLESIPDERCQLNVKCVFKNANCGNGAPCKYGRVNVEDALAVSSDVFFYKIGEEIFIERGNRPILEEQVRLFGFGSPTEIDLPYEFIGTVPSRLLKLVLLQKKRVRVITLVTASSSRSDRVCCLQRHSKLRLHTVFSVMVARY
jgi:penicillin-binding protein 2